METVRADVTPVAPAPTGRGVGQSLVAWTRRPEWPLAVVFAWYPLWWLLGVTQLATLAATVVMVARLLRMRSWTLPRGLGWWLLFLVWVGAGVLVLQVDVPGALPEHSSTRYLTWALRVIWLCEATTVLVYVTNLRRQLAARRVTRILAAMFVTIVAGGLAGSLAPGVQLQSLVEVLLPHHVATQQFVVSLVHPTLAEHQVYLDQVVDRASAPFPYANDWGLNFACFLPFFVVAWLGRDSGWRRFAAPLVLASACVPVIYSLNRGLWAILLVLLVLTAAKHAAAGHLKPLAVLAGGALLGVLLVTLSPLSGVLSARFTGHNSNEGRTNFSALTVVGMAKSSPVMGVGTTRAAQGSFYSLAGGTTSDCATCTPPALGTQGFLWWILFATGFGGAFLALTFLLSHLWRHRRGHDPIRIASQCTLLAFVLALPIYDWTVTAGCAAMAAIALLERTSPHARTSAPIALPLRLPGPGAQPTAWVGLAVVGALAGVAWQVHHGTTYVARAEIYLPEDPTAAPSARDSTLDSAAPFVNDAAVLRARPALRRADLGRHRGRLWVDATANTRILGVNYTSTDRTRGLAVVTSVAAATASAVQAESRAAHAVARAGARQRLAGDVVAADTLDRGLALSLGSAATSLGAVHLLTAQSQIRLDEVDQTDALEAVRSADRLRNVIVGSPTVERSPEQWNVSAGSGMLLGLLAAAGTERLRRGRARIGTADQGLRHSLGLDLPVLHEIPSGSASYLSADSSDATLCATVRRCAARGGSGPPPAGPIVLVASPANCVPQILRTVSDLRSRGITVAAIYVAGDVRGA